MNHRFSISTFFRLSLWLALGLGLMAQSALSQGTVRWRGASSTDWATAGNWVVVSGTPSTPPGAGDAVQIGTGAITNQPTLSAPTTVASLTYGNSAASTLTLNASLTVTGAITNTIITTARVHNINLSSGNTLSAASANLSPAVAAANMTITFNGGTFAVSGNFTAQPTTATTTITLTVGTGTFSVGGTTLQGAAINAQQNCDITVSTGTLNFGGNYTKDGAGSDLTSSGAAKISFGGTVTNTRGTSFNLSGSTTTLNGTGNIAATTAMTFGNVVTGPAAAPTFSTGTINIAKLTVQGSATIGASTVAMTDTTTVNGTLNITSTTGTKTFNDILINPGGIWNSSVNEAYTINGSIRFDGNTFTAGTGVYTLAGAGKTISGLSALAIPSITMTGSYTNAADLTVSTALGGAGSFANGTGGVLNFGAATIAVTTFTATAVGNTVNYIGAAAQTIRLTTYDNLSVTKTGGTATFGGNTTINNNFTVASGTAAIGAFTVTVNDSTNITGTLNITSATGTKTFVGLVTINSGGVWNNSGNEAVTFRGGLIHNGTTFTAGTGVYTFDTNPQAIGGSSPITIPRITVTGVTLDNNANLTVTTALAGTGGLTNADTLNINFTGAVGITTLTASSTGNVVNYAAAGAQTIDVPVGSTYHHLALTTSGAKTAGGSLTVSGDLTLSGTATFNAGTSLTHTFSGNWVLNTTAVTPFTFTTGSIINFETPTIAVQTSLGGTSTATIAFNSVNVNNTSGFALNENASISGTLTVGSGATLVPAAADIVSGSGTLTGSGTVKVTRTAATPDFLSQYPIAAMALTNLTVDYDATSAQSVNALNYFNLTISGARGSSIVTLPAGVAGVSGAFNPAATFTSGAYGIAGNTIDFNGGGAQIVPAFDYNSLALSNSGTKVFDAGTEGIADVLTISGTAAVDATTNTTTVHYNGTVAQTVTPMTYGSLLFSGSGAKQVGGAVIANGTVTNTPGTSLTVLGTGSMTVNGEFDNEGSLTNNGSIIVQ